MKKSFLNIAVTTALSGIVFSGSILSTQAYAENLISDDIVIADNNTSNNTMTENYLYTGMGLGAASGALVAGPVGLLVGGVIGAFAGSRQDASPAPEADTTLTENTALPENSESNTLHQGVQVAQLGEISTVVESPIESQHKALLDILTADLSLDIYFRSGSSNIETFYPARLTAIADLMNTMAQLELHLDGYSDRRGDKTKNIALAKQRIEKVREQLINAGVDKNRIVSKAFGEMKMVSSAGDLEAYTFDRKVVIRFQRITADSILSMTTALSELKTEAETANTDAVIANTVVTNTGIEF